MINGAANVARDFPPLKKTLDITHAGQSGPTPFWEGLARDIYAVDLQSFDSRDHHRKNRSLSRPEFEQHRNRYPVGG